MGSKIDLIKVTKAAETMLSHLTNRVQQQIKTQTTLPKRVLFIDTETTGLPLNKWQKAHQQKGNWPDIVSVAWEIYESAKLVSKNYYLIKPRGWKIHPESTNIHGITQEYAERNGYNFAEVMRILKQDLQSANMVVAHNLEFDKNVIYNAFIWHLEEDPTTFWPITEFCTMVESEPELKLPNPSTNTNIKSKKKYKSPRLDELYVHTFGKDPEKAAHNSQRDVEVLVEIFMKRWVEVK